MYKLNKWPHFTWTDLICRTHQRYHHQWLSNTEWSNSRRWAWGRDRWLCMKGKSEKRRVLIQEWKTPWEMSTTKGTLTVLYVEVCRLLNECRSSQPVDFVYVVYVSSIDIFKSRISLNVSCQGVCYTFVTLPVVQRCQTSFVVCLRLNLLRHVRVLITTAMKENQWTRGRCHDDRQTDRPRECSAWGGVAHRTRFQLLIRSDRQGTCMRGRTQHVR